MRSRIKKGCLALRRKADKLLFGLKIENAGQPRIFGYRRYLANKFSQKRALLAYLPGPLIKQLYGEPIYQFGNEGLAVSIPRALNELGYSVDIVGWDDTNFVPKSHYDLFIAHGGQNFAAIHDTLNRDCATIYYSTGSYWKFHNAQEQERLDYFKKRHGITLPPDRYIDASEETANSASDGIICLSNEAGAATYAKFDPVARVTIAAYPNPSPLAKATTPASKRRFLFFAGGGNVHKGLDLLLDIFPALDAELYICTPLDPEFAKFYDKQLANTPNIHYLGVVGLRSPEFYKVTSDCSFVIMPSCSEGSPGSIVECMLQGLVPVITSECHLDTGDFGIILEDYRLDYLAKSLEAVLELPLKEVETRSTKAPTFAAAHHTPKLFRADFKRAVTSILQQVGNS